MAIEFTAHRLSYRDSLNPKNERDVALQYYKSYIKKVLYCLSLNCLNRTIFQVDFLNEVVKQLQYQTQLQV